MRLWLVELVESDEVFGFFQDEVVWLYQVESTVQDFQNFRITVLLRHEFYHYTTQVIAEEAHALMGSQVKHA